MEPTDNHEFQIWEYGERPWNHIADFEKLEERLAVRDAESNRSDYTAYDGARFIATDTGAVYDGNGSSWTLSDREVNNLDVQTDLSVGDDLTVSDVLTVNGSADISSGSISTDLSVGDDLTVSDLLTVNGSADINGTIEASTFNGGDFSGSTVSASTFDGGSFDGTDITGDTLSISGSKDFVHETDDGDVIVYSAQESDDVRAVHEGQVSVKTSAPTTIPLPDHFTAVVSDTPKLRVQVTPHEPAMVGVPERSPSEITVDVADAESEHVLIDYRVTGVRDGFEDKTIVHDETQ